MDRGAGLRDPLTFEILRQPGPWQLDLGPSFVEVYRKFVTAGSRVADASAAFHSTVVHATVELCAELARREDVGVIALSGGVFCNVFLLRHCVAQLEARGLRVLYHRLLPPGDGGISAGQVFAAAQLLSH